MTPQTLITTVRGLVNDADSVLYRYSNTTLLSYVNDGMKEISVLRPELFTVIGDMLCTSGQVEQAVPFTSAQAIVDVLCIHDGDAITPFDLDSMNKFNPGWRGDTAGAAKQWSRIPGVPLRFFIYPAAPISQSIDLSYVAVPTTLGLTDSITEIPAGYEPALVDYVVYRVESTDDEHVSSGRAVASYASFVSKIKG